MKSSNANPSQTVQIALSRPLDCFRMAKHIPSHQKGTPSMFDHAHGHRMNYRIMKLERYIERHGLEDSEKHTDRLEQLYQMRSDLQRLCERQVETVQLGKGRFGM